MADQMLCPVSRPLPCVQNTVEASLAGQSYVTKASIAVLILFWLVSKWSTWAYKMLAASPGM